MPGTIGYNTIGASTDTALSTWNVEGQRGTPYQYTAVSGDAVTQVAIYGQTASGSTIAELAVYAISGTTVGAMVGSPVQVTIDTTLGWHTASANIALTAGTTYVICIDWYVSGTTSWTLYWDSPAGSVPTYDNATALPATWSEASSGAGAVSYYATVAASGQSTSPTDNVGITDTANVALPEYSISYAYEIRID